MFMDPLMNKDFLICVKGQRETGAVFDAPQKSRLRFPSLCPGSTLLVLSDFYLSLHKLQQLCWLQSSDPRSAADDLLTSEIALNSKVGSTMDKLLHQLDHWMDNT